MALQVVTTTQTQVRFTVTDPDRPDLPSFSDALYFDGAPPSAATVRQQGTVRYQAWRQTLDARPPRPPRAERIAAAREARDTAIGAASAAEAALAAEQASVDP